LEGSSTTVYFRPHRPSGKILGSAPVNPKKLRSPDLIAQADARPAEPSNTPTTHPPTTTNNSAATMKVGKPTSKRVSTRLHHNIKKKSAEKQRKDRKAAKKNPQWVSRLKKDPGIPNSYPFKAQILAEIEEQKLKKEAEQQERRETAKARREGRAVVDEPMAGPSGRAAAGALEMDAGLVDMEGDEDMEDDGSNPMAALLASAQARALEHVDDEDDDEDDDDEDSEEEAGVAVQKKKAPSAQKPVAVRKTLPKQALADPIKAVAALMEKMEKTEDGVQRLVDYYQLAPIVTAHSDLPTRFLVDVARKRGRLGRGGVPNLHAASLVVLNDINEDRIRLPTVKETKKVGPKGKSQVTIVQTMAEPFKIAGLWGDETKGADAMET
jgi:nuclear GTP-binding protein